ncbi:phage major capsid protein [Clostridium kluyveri]|uniref:phage major capsid protein n=1 Tax=Clostridium kluyveri TaxID=1534 RepID=UPI002244FE63|nr:phage major capsid protein [Clostridium kluyveri]UZQ51593.1 phage major capsid protein [Clostridium kluyveri]
MAIKQLMISKKIEQRKSALAELLKTETDLNKRAADLEQSIEEAKTDEEIAAVEEETNKLDNDKTEFDKKKSKLEGEISDLEGELEELKSNEPKNNPEPAARSNVDFSNIRGGLRMMGNRYETREQILERLNREDVREFYTRVAALAKEKRAVAGTEVIIPESVIDMIQTRLGDYSTLYPEVTLQTLNGTARVVMDGAIPEGIWTEMTDAVQELSAGFSQTELDGFKVGGFIPVANAILEDSMINLANYIETRLSMAIAKALDKAILTGAAASKQPTGIITALGGTGLEAHNVTSDGTLKNIVSHMSVIDDGEDGAPIGEVIAVMKRSFYYAEIAPQTFLPTSDGRLVIQTAQSPRLPDGTRIVFSQYMPANTILLGDFKKYLLGERKGVQLAVSDQVRFIEDQTVFKGTARYDGKPVYPSYFVKITIAETP